MKSHESGWLCPKCGLRREYDRGPDPCLGILPGVLFACCGHGKTGGYGYIMFENGVTVRFDTYIQPSKRSAEELAESTALHDYMHGFRGK